MVNTNETQPQHSSEFLLFIERDIGLSKEALDLGIRQSRLENAPLSVVLWSLGLITLEQYQEIIKWLYQKNN